MTIYNVNAGKIGKSFPVDFDSLPAVSQAYIIQRGFDHLNDVHAAIHATAKDKEGKLLYPERADLVAAVESAITEKLAMLSAGEISARRGSSEPADPVARIVLRLAKAAVTKALKDQRGWTPKTIGEDKFAILVSAYTEKHREDLEGTAAAEIKRLSKHSAEIDLSELEM